METKKTFWGRNGPTTLCFHDESSGYEFFSFYSLLNLRPFHLYRNLQSFTSKLNYVIQLMMLKAQSKSAIEELAALSLKILIFWFIIEHKLIGERFPRA